MTFCLPLMEYVSLGLLATFEAIVFRLERVITLSK